MGPGLGVGADVLGIGEQSSNSHLLEKKKEKEQCER